MSFSPSDAGTLHAGLTRRLAGALAASLALHLYALAVLDALPRGMRWGELALLQPGGARSLRVTLQPLAAGPAPETPVAPPAETVPTAAAPAAVPPRAGADATPAPAPAFSPRPAQRYYTTREVDARPGILMQVEPEYPEAAARRFLSGRVVARLLIDETGAVEKVAVVSAEPPGYFEAAAEKAFLAARFTPGIKDGRPVRVQMLLEINFDSQPAPKPPSGG